MLKAATRNVVLGVAKAQQLSLKVQAAFSKV